MGYRIRRTDVNQKSIVAHLRSLGCVVAILSEIGNGIPDLLIAHPLVRGWSSLIELKDGDKPPSARRLTPDEEKFHLSWPGELHVIASKEEASALIENLLHRDRSL